MSNLKRMSDIMKRKDISISEKINLINKIKRK